MRSGIAILCLLPTIAVAQDEALARLQAEAVNLRTTKLSSDGYDTPIARTQLAEQNWIESKLPKSRREFLDRAARLEEELKHDLKAAGLTPEDAPKKDDIEGTGFGYASVRVQRFAEFPDMAFVTASVTVGCGAEDSVYGYKFDATGWRRVIDARDEDMGDAELKLSEPDSSGQRLLLVNWYSQQCASNWRAITYKVFRLDWDNGVARRALEDHTGFWMGDGKWPLFVLYPTTMTVEFSDSSVDGGVHHRTKIQRYALTVAAHRIDPVALQPQDFAEEWLTRPWSEMESRSAPVTKALHESFGTGEVGGEYVEMTQCSPQQPVWLAGFDIDLIGEKQLQEPRRVYLQISDLGDHRYRMESASSVRPASCKADPGNPGDKYPWLSEEEIRKLK
jgi:hypothetical protein